MATIKPVYGTVTRLSTLETNIAASLASSLDLVAGTCSEIIDLTATPVLDVVIQGSVRVGTTPIAGRTVALYVIPEATDAPLWPTSVTTGANTTFASTDSRANACAFASMAFVPVATSNVDYNFKPISVASLFMGVVPKRFVVFFVHNTNVVMNTTASNHRIEYYTVNMEST